MNRIALLTLCLLAGCQSAPEALPVQPRPAEGEAVSFGDLLLRARGQATTATEAYYIDNWVGIQNAATALEQTASLLTKSTEVPESRRPQLPSDSANLALHARGLREAAQASDVKRIAAELQQIHLQVRLLQAAPASTPEP